MSLALYRRYRPDTFAGVIGQDQVTVPLMRALDNGKLTHAYLFSGPRGCGKTSSARILARCINCAQGPTSTPCGECESCKDLATNGPGSIDVVEIDAASHNGVDDARELRERAGFAPARDRYKIFILDEAHMVTPQGFNALLKIVEEPPEHVMFIFATTEPEKVISTIRSRTHHYPFRLVPAEVMGPYLESVCEKEDIRPEQGVLKLAMRAGGGSVRDTLSVLDQLMVGAENGVITMKSAVALLGFTPHELITQVIDAIINKDGASLYGAIQAVVVGGYDPRKFVEDILEYVRDLLLLTLGGSQVEQKLISSNDEQTIADFHRQVQALSLTALTQIAHIIDESLASMTGTVSPRLRLELLAAKLLAIAEQGYASTPALGNGVASVSPTGASSAIASQAVAQDPRRQGFIGSRMAKKPIRETSAQAQTVPAQTGAASHENSGVPASVMQANSSATSPQRNTQEVAHFDSQEQVDASWDALVKELPADAREYVSRENVTEVHYQLSAQGKARLSMTFASALSQHAFSLAVVGQEGAKASHVVLEAVRKVFGAQTMIAPTKVAANGEEVVPIKRLSAQQVAQVKTQIAMAKAGLAAAQISRQLHVQSSDNVATSVEGNNEDDGWAHREGESIALASSAAPSPQAEADKPKHVAVPDMSDDYDPWADTAVTQNVASVMPQSSADISAGTAQSHEKQVPPVSPRQVAMMATQQQEATYAENGQNVAQSAPGNDPWSNTGVVSAGVTQTQEIQPQVAAEEDEYSLSDESIESAGNMSVDDVRRMFDVNQVEHFDADDPRNPVHDSANGHSE